MDEQVQRITSLMTAWQAAVHDLYDAAPPVENDGPQPETMGRIGDDFHLLTGFSWLTPETRAKCLALLPEGVAITPMVEAWLGPAAQLTEAEACTALAAGVERVAAAVADPGLDPVPAWGELGNRLPEMVPCGASRRRQRCCF